MEWLLEQLEGISPYYIEVFSALALIAFVVYIYSAYRSWKVQQAILEMQKDLADIKHGMAVLEVHSNSDSST